MRKIFKLFFAFFVAITLSVTLWAQENFFTKVGEDKTIETTGERMIIPSKFYTTTLDIPRLKNYLWSLPSEQRLAGNRSQAPVLELPMPDGSLAKFRVWESSVQAPELQAKFPEIKTFAGQGIDDPYATIRFDFNPYLGFSAQILSPNGRIYIDPYARWDVNKYISYYQKDAVRRYPFICSFDETQASSLLPEQGRIQAGPCVGTQLRTYRLAVACTAEYAAAVGGGAAGPTHAAIVNSVNRITGVYEAELAIRLVLVANNDLIEYLANPDPYSNVISSSELTTNQNNIDLIIGAANYDIGHLFTSDDNGVAQLMSVCTSSKARGATGSPNLIGDGFDIDFVAHEMGHQFGATHTFNAGTCASSGTPYGYEPGGGTTIMAYAGICAPSDNIQPNSDPIFHAISFDQIGTFITSGSGASCAVSTPTGNQFPVIQTMSSNNVSIPIGTPFTLTATAMDPDGDAITYNWEGWDVNPTVEGTWTTAANSTTRALFRTRLPKTTGSRTFPDPRVIAANYPGVLTFPSPPSVMDGLRGEVLPQVERTMKFKLTVRDNRAGGGGVVSGGDGCQTGFTGIFQVNAVGTTPFEITTQNTPVTYSGGSTQTVSWLVAGTNSAPINTANVRISLSTDGGLTFPYELVASTPNDGSESVTITNIATTTARIKVEAIDNIFFDINNTNFTITSSAGFTFDNPSPATVACPAPASVNISLGTTSVGGFSTPINLSATAGVPAGTNVTFGTNPVTPGNSSVVTLNNTNTLAAGSYTITITGIAGSTTQTREITYTIQAGTGPAISVQPQAQTVCAGTNAVFSVTAPGALSYQWQVSTNGGGSFSNISGAISSTYTATSVTAGMNNNQYRVLITGQCNTTTSNAALLTVQTAPAITTHPASSTLCLGSNAMFTVAANGTGISYQWQISTNGGASFNPIGGATSGSYTENNITTGMNNNQYRVVITGTCTPAVTSNAGTLTVISPVTVTTNPDNVTICETGNVSFTAAGSGSGVLYQWQVSTNGGASYSDIGGATAATLNVNAVTAGMNDNRYRALMWNATCTTPAVTTEAILTVNARPTVTISAAPQTQLQPGESTVINAAITPSATGFDIMWFKNNSTIAGVNGTSHTVDVTGIGNYQVKIVNQVTGCNNESNILPITAEASERLFVFPSPNNGQFTVSYYNSAGANTQQTITVYNSYGALVYSAKMPVTGQYTLHDINMKGKASGVYIVVIGDAAGKKLAQEKVVIGY